MTRKASAWMAAVGVVVVLAVLITGGVLAQSSDGAKTSGAGGATPVAVGTVEAKDVPVYAFGLGTVQANYTVTVKSRVDGQITDVFFREGQDVKAGDRLFQIDPRPYQASLDQATAAKVKDSATLRAAQLDLDRFGALVGKGFQTRQSYDEQKGTVEAGAASVNADQAAIDAAKLNLVYADIRSPIDGRTGARLVDPGNYVQASAATGLVSITQIKPIFVSFTVPEAQLDPIRENQAKAPLSVTAFSGTTGKELATGKLTLIDNQVDPSTGTIHLKASYANEDEQLWPGEFVNARVTLSTRKGVSTVPAQTVMQGPDGPYVYRVKPDNTVQRVDVKVGATQDGLTVLESGLTVGDKVVVAGQYRLSDGARIEVGNDDPQRTAPAG